MTSNRGALARGALVFAVVAPATYMALLLYGRWRAKAVVDPSLIILASHVGFLWRVAIASWFGAVWAGVWVVGDLSPPKRGVVAVIAALVVLAFAYP